MNIGIIGTTPEAETLARLMHKGGHAVTISDPAAPADADRLAAQIDGKREIPYKQAQTSDVLVLAVPWSELPRALARLGPAPNAVVLDAMIPDGPVRSSGAEQLAHMMDNRHVVEVLPRGLHPNATVPLCGDDPQAKKTAMDLLRTVGLQPTDIGVLARAGDLERSAQLQVAV